MAIGLMMMADFAANVARLRELASDESRLIFLVSGCGIKNADQKWVSAVHAQAFVGGISVGQAGVEVVDGDWLDAMRRAKRKAAATWRAIQSLLLVQARMLSGLAYSGVEGDRQWDNE